MIAKRTGARWTVSATEQEEDGFLQIGSVVDPPRPPCPCPCPSPSTLSPSSAPFHRPRPPLAAGLANLSPDTLSMAMQVDPESNPMTGIQGRANLLANLAKALGEDSQGFFSGPAGDPANTDKDKRRPGFIVGTCSSTARIPALALTHASLSQTTWPPTRARQSTQRQAAPRSQCPRSGKPSFTAWRPSGRPREPS